MLAQGIGRFRRDLSPAALVTTAGVPISGRLGKPWSERAGGSNCPPLWQTGRRRGRRSQAASGNQDPAQLVHNRTPDFQMEVRFDGQALTPTEVDQFRSTPWTGSPGVKTVEVDPEWLEVFTLPDFRRPEHLGKDRRLREALAMLAEASNPDKARALMDADQCRLSSSGLQRPLKDCVQSDDLGSSTWETCCTERCGPTNRSGRWPIFYDVRPGA